MTTVRQRPLWRLFPTREGEWVLWRWRDYYYDTNSARADRLVGWQVNPAGTGGDQTPAFYPLEWFRDAGFHNPAKIWGTITEAFQKPDKVLFPDLEPPDVNLAEATRPGATRDLVLRVTVRPRSKRAAHKVVRLALWLDDVRLDAPLRLGEDGSVDAPVTIRRDRLRQGVNRITLIAYTEQGGRGEKAVLVAYSDPARPRPDLHALCVGINDYGGLRGGLGVKDLACASPDAAEVARILEQHAGGVFAKAHVTALLDRKATAAAITAELKAMRARARPDDWLVLFLAGHGQARLVGKGYEPGSFYYLCADSDGTRDETLLYARRLRDLLAEVPCRKLILVDACRSGAVVSDPVRDFNSEGVRFLIFAAARGDQAALEPGPGAAGGARRHGFFTQGLMAALGDSREGRGKRRLRAVTAEQMARAIQDTVGRLLLGANQKTEEQTPVFDPEPPPAIPVLARP